MVKIISLQDYIVFYKLAKKRKRSNDDYIQFEYFQAGIVINSLKKKGVQFNGKKVLDIGCGRGGYSLKLFHEGADVVSLDIISEYFQHHQKSQFILGNAVLLPFKSESFDFVFCSSLIEHVKTPNILIKEIKRVMKKGGNCYLSFPPFWSLAGAHQFKPFHYLGEKIAIKLSRKLYGVKSYSYNDKYGKLYKRKISQIKKYILDNNLKIRHVSTRMSSINFARIPVLNELLTWHVEFLLEK